MAQGIGVGLDIGGEAVRAVRLRVAEREVQVLDSASVRRDSLGVAEGDPDAVAQAAAMHLAGRGFRRGKALAGLSAEEADLRYLRAAPETLPHVVEREVRQAGGVDPRAFVTAAQPLAPREAGEMLYLAAFSRQQLLERRAAALAAGGHPVEGFCPEAAALATAFRCSVPEGTRGTLVLLDIGARRTHVVYLHDGAFLFARTLALGGAGVTQAVAEALGVEWDEAEEVKRRRGAILPAEDIRRDLTEDARLYDRLRQAADELCRAVQTTLSYARAQTGVRELEPAAYYLAGGGARLDGLREHLGRELGKPVRWLDLAGWLAGGQAVAEPPSPYALAVGLAAAAAGREAAVLRLVPPQVQRQRRFWTRGVFGVAAAVFLVVALALHARGLLAERQRARDALALLEDRRAEAEKARARVQRARRQFEDTRRKANLVADAARANPLVLRVLDALRRAAPDGIVLTSVTCAPAPAADSPPGAAPTALVVRLQGVAGEQGGRPAAEVLRAFVRRLCGPPLLATVVDQAQPEPRGAGSLAFQLSVSPSSPLTGQEGADAPASGR